MKGGDTPTVMQILLRTLLYLICLTVGVLLMAWAKDPSLVHGWQAHIHSLEDERYWMLAAVGAGGLCVFIVVFSIYRSWMQHRFSRDVTYTTALGQVSVSLLAIEEALSRSVERETGVRKVRINVYEDRHRRMIIIECIMTLWDDANVTAWNRRCQEIIQRRFQELMPDQTAVQIHIRMHRLRQRPEDKKADKEALKNGTTTVDRSQAITEVAPSVDRRETINQDWQNEQASLHPAPAPVGQVPVEPKVSPDDLPLAVEVDRTETDSEVAIADFPQEVVEVDSIDPSRIQTSSSTEAEEDFDDLYFGPSYPVVPDQEIESDYSGSALPAEPKPKKP